VARRGTTRTNDWSGPLRTALRAVVVAVVVAVPLASTDRVLNSFAVPKMAVLLVGAAALAGLLLVLSTVERGLPFPASRASLVVGAYVASLALTTAFSVEPAISVQGAVSSQMGLLAWLCFAVCFAAVLAGAHRNAPFVGRLTAVVALTGGLVAALGIAQFVRMAAADWAAVASGNEAVRVYATIGHPDYAGNFLLFPTFLAIGLAATAASAARRSLYWSTALVSAVAIVYSGTRGAWLGMVAGAALGAWMVVRGADGARWRTRSAGRRVLAAAGALVVLGLVVGFTPVGASVRNRASKFYSEGFTGAGRTTIWQLSASMVPAYWATGCGLETYRLAQIPFKTADFERTMNGTTAEDPHSAYLSHLVATGVVSTGLYLAVIAFALANVVSAIRAAGTRAERLSRVALLCALASSLVHDLFLHHMLADGLYLFVCLALATAHRNQLAPATVEPRPRPSPAALAAVSIVGVALVCGAGYYAWRIVAADRAILVCIGAARAGNDDLARRYGARAVDSAVYQTDYHFLFAAALEQLAERRPDLDTKQRLELAAAELDEAHARTLTPVNSFVSSALLKVRLGRLDEAAEDLRRAEQLDPISGLPQLGWSSYYLNAGDLDRAVQSYVEARRRGVLFSRAAPLDARLWSAVRSAENRRELRRMLDHEGRGTGE
jgi:putative inorganic carbon (HCO3(-)) transporter